MVSTSEEVTNVQKKIMAALSRQCYSTQCIEHPGISCKNNIAVLEQPSYSPDLAPCYFLLFSELKRVSKRRRFRDVEAIKMAVTKKLGAIPDRSLQECMEAYQRRMAKCVRSQGDYFKGDML